MKAKMTDGEKALIRARHQEGLRDGMSIAEASEYANQGLAPCADDEAARTRQRFSKALRDGKSQEEATAYANNPDLAEPSVPAGADAELTAAPSAAEGSGDPQSHLVGDSGSVAKAAALPLQPAFSACTVHHR